MFSQAHKTPDAVLISALRILAEEIQSPDGVANAAIAEAADRLEELASPCLSTELCGSWPVGSLPSKN